MPFIPYLSIPLYLCDNIPFMPLLLIPVKPLISEIGATNIALLLSPRFSFPTIFFL